jgi:peptidoglycan hydrolase CwlO-like protein
MNSTLFVSGVLLIVLLCARLTTNGLRDELAEADARIEQLELERDNLAEELESSDLIVDGLKQDLASGDRTITGLSRLLETRGAAVPAKD